MSHAKKLGNLLALWQVTCKRDLIKELTPQRLYLCNGYYRHRERCSPECPLMKHRGNCFDIVPNLGAPGLWHAKQHLQKGEYAEAYKYIRREVDSLRLLEESNATKKGATVNR